MKTERRITIDGRRYTVRTRSYDSFLNVVGPGIVGGFVLPAGTAIDADDLPKKVRSAIESYRERHKAASEAVQRRVQDDTAGLGRE